MFSSNSNQPAKTSSFSSTESEKQMPLMGFGTFIGNQESDNITNTEQRLQLTETAVFNALIAGYRHLDCASNYNNEEAVGEALKQAFKPISSGGLGLKREDIWITTKGDCRGDSLRISLAKLGVSYVDLYLAHHPTFFQDKTALSNAWDAMNHLVDEGLTTHIGVSNCYFEHLTRLIAVCQEKRLRLPYANEIEIHPLLQETELVNFCKNNGIHVIAYSPLGYLYHGMVLDMPEIQEVAQETQATPAQVALAWNMSRGVAVIPKSAKANHIVENFNATQITLTEPQMNKINNSNAEFIHITDTSIQAHKQATKLKWW